MKILLVTLFRSVKNFGQSEPCILYCVRLDLLTILKRYSNLRHREYV